MKFLEAQKLIKNASNFSPFDINLAMSGNVGQLETFVQAEGALKEKCVAVKTLAFSTLQQTALSGEKLTEASAAILFPWDLVNEFDWRSGVPEHVQEHSTLLENALPLADAYNRVFDHIIYIPAAVPDIYPDRGTTDLLHSQLCGLAYQAGWEVYDTQAFSLSSYFLSGAPLGTSAIDKIAKNIIDHLIPLKPTSKKVIVTDLDNVMWKGVVAEDGAQGVECAPEGVGYKHFLYQSLLKRLVGEGSLLVAVTRNHPVIDPPSFQKGSFALTKDYQKILRRLDTLLAPGGVVMACVNSPQVSSQFLLDSMKENAPLLKYEKRLDNLPVFKDIDEESSLKTLIFKSGAAASQQD